MHSHATQARDDTFDSVHGRLRSTYQRYSICRPIYQVKCDPKCDIQFLDRDGVFMVIIAVCFGSALYTARLFCLRESNFLLSLMPRKKSSCHEHRHENDYTAGKDRWKMSGSTALLFLAVAITFVEAEYTLEPSAPRRRQFVGAAALFC